MFGVQLESNSSSYLCISPQGPRAIYLRKSLTPHIWQNTCKLVCLRFDPNEVNYAHVVCRVEHCS